MRATGVTHVVLAGDVISVQFSPSTSWVVGGMWGMILHLLVFYVGKAIRSSRPDVTPSAWLGSKHQLTNLPSRAVPHGREHPLRDVVRPALPLLTVASATLQVQGVLKDGFGKAAMAYGTSKSLGFHFTPSKQLKGLVWVTAASSSSDNTTAHTFQSLNRAAGRLLPHRASPLLNGRWLRS